MNGPPAGTDFDVVVVGAGLGGLSSAALLARAGYSVAVVEKNGRPGGCAQTFLRAGLVFDPAIHFTIDAGPGGFTPAMLDHLGVADQVRFVATETTYRACFPGTSVQAPPGREAFLAEHQRVFPDQAGALADLFAMREAMFAQLAALPQKIGPAELDDAMVRSPLVFRYRMATLSDVLGEYLTDARAAAAVGAIWPYVGSAPSRMSFLLFNQMLESMHAGTYYALGSFQTLADALASAVTANGGSVLCDAQVTGIRVSDGRARGVEVAGGGVLAAEAVISNVDARRTFGDLVGWDHLSPGLRRRVERGRLSPSAFVLYGTFHGDPRALGLEHETLVFGDWDHERTWADVQAGRPGGVWISAPSLIDPGLGPDGTQIGVITSLAPADADGAWSSRRAEWTDRLLSLVEESVPGVRDAFTVVDTATPDTFHRYTGSSGGAAYGWENIPAQTASKRLSHRTDVEGLYLSGHWVEEGTSSLRALTSGRATAALVAAQLGRGEPIPDFGGPSFLADAAERRPVLSR